MNRFVLLISLAAVGLLAVGACAMPSLTPPPSQAATIPANDEPAEENPAALDTSTAEVSPTPPPLVDEGKPPPFDTDAWRTNFARRSVAWNEIISGGPPKDGIPAIDDPTFESVESASDWLTPREPVILFEHDDEARAYPLSILIWHEIVNDEVAGLPVAVTFCPLCNASIVFDRRFEGKVLDFGTTGKLRNSDLIMYDRQSETWWQQFTGEAIVGKWTGRQLTFLPSQVVSFGDFAAEHPAGKVLARPTINGYPARNYGRNPYVGYDSDEQPFLFTGQVDPRLSAVERVVGLTTETAARAYPFETVTEAGVLNDTFGGTPLVIFHKRGTASALDTSAINEGRDVGTVGVFRRRVGDQTLTFNATGEGTFVDEETGTTWNVFGEGIAGPLAGESLTEILHFDHFWFAWAAFFPQTEVYEE